MWLIFRSHFKVFKQDKICSSKFNNNAEITSSFLLLFIIFYYIFLFLHVTTNWCSQILYEVLKHFCYLFFYYSIFYDFYNVYLVCVWKKKVMVERWNEWISRFKSKYEMCCVGVTLIKYVHVVLFILCMICIDRELEKKIEFYAEWMNFPDLSEYWLNVNILSLLGMNLSIILYNITPDGFKSHIEHLYWTRKSK